MLAGLLCLAGCNLPDESKLKINWQSMLARDNIWFNANEKIKVSKAELRKQQEDKFDKILPVFTFGTEAQRKGLIGEMDEVLKKTGKVVKKYRISRWIDDSYFLMGQAHFFKGDYYSAIETFQYINTKYKKSLFRSEATLWIMKSYLYMGKPDEAEAIYSLIKSDKKWPKKHIAELEAVVAEINIREGKNKQAVQNLRVALKHLDVLHRYEKARYSFILGQLYQKLELFDSANIYFKKCIKYNPPFDMAFHARMNLAKAYNAGSEAKSIKRSLRKMIRDDKNISYYDQIYYELGLIFLREKNIPESVKHFNLSLRSSQKNFDQKSLTYLALAEMYFNLRPKPDYRNAQAYFDSTASIIPKDNPDYQKVLDKKEVLGELISNLLVIEETDSFLKLADLPSARLDKALDQMVEAEKQRKALQDANKVDPTNPIISNPLNLSGTSSFYFDNSALAIAGLAEFKRKWGDRKNTDFWRLAAKANEVMEVNTNQLDTGKEIEEPEESKLADNKLYKSASPEKKALMRKIPFTDKGKIEAENNIANALCGNGIIYYEKLNDLDEAEETFQGLMLRYPQFDKMDRVFYTMYKLKKERGEDKEAKRYKKMLMDKYPKSDYARLLGKQAIKDNFAEANKVAIDFYEATYQEYTDGHFAEVKKQVKESEKKFPGTVLQPKFDFLLALASSHTDSLSVYETNLKLVDAKYPNTDEADKAKRLLEAIDRYRAGMLNKADSVVNQTKVEEKKGERGDYKNTYASRFFYVLAVPKGTDVNQIKIKFSDLNMTYHTLEGLEGRLVSLNEEYQLYRISEFKEKQAAVDYVREVDEHPTLLNDMKISGPKHFAITEDNLLILLKTKDLEGYLEFFGKSF
ncbi:MAG: hypothetical protein EXR21_05465 [Flavobacteriaceae bacterium]|nr:hypothetical protein [Flavobacteriaceae bacterium]